MSEKLEILKGQRFGRLTALSFKEKRGTIAYWLCECDCGQTKVVSKYHLVHGKIKSCGCIRKETTSNTRLKNVIGQRFGRLIVLSRSTNPIYRQVFWICRCECGSVVDVMAGNLSRGNTKSCGCLSNDIKRARATLLTFEACAKDRFIDYKKGAEQRKLSFLLSLEEFIKITSQNCHYCNLPPSQVIPSNRAKIVYFYSGIDRKDNSIGYEVDNCIPCCKQCNFAKSSRSYTEFISWLRRAGEYQNESSKTETSIEISLVD